MGESLKDMAKKVVESIKKVFKPSTEEIKDNKEPQEPQDSTVVNTPGRPEPVIGPAGF